MSMFSQRTPAQREASATLSPFTEGEPPYGRSQDPWKDVNPESEMTTRGYEHQRGLQAQEGQTKAVRPTNWTYTPVTVEGLCPTLLPRGQEGRATIKVKSEGLPLKGQADTARAAATPSHCARASLRSREPAVDLCSRDHAG